MQEHNWFVDLSKTEVVNKEQVTELLQNGCVGFAVRSGRGEDVDPMLDKHVKLLKKLNAPFFLFHDLDPNVKYDAQVARLMGLVEQYEPKAIGLVIEQWWMDWKEYVTVHIKGLPGYVRPMNENQLVRAYRPITLEVKRQNKNKLPIIGKSSPLFIHTYARQMAAVIRDECDFFWNESYFDYLTIGREVEADWETFNASIDKVQVPAAMLPRGFREYGMWTHAVIPVPGFGHLSSALIKPEVAEKVFGLEPVAQPLDDLGERLEELEAEAQAKLDAEIEEAIEAEAEELSEPEDDSVAIQVELDQDEEEKPKTSRRKKK